MGVETPVVGYLLPRQKGINDMKMDFFGEYIKQFEEQIFLRADHFYFINHLNKNRKHIGLISFIQSSLFQRLIYKHFPGFDATALFAQQPGKNGPYFFLN